jgi:hypothetical protein
MSADTLRPDPERRSADDAFAMSIAAMIGRLADRPERLRATLNGMSLDGSLRRMGLPAGLAPMMRLPAPEPERQVRARMAELMVRRFSADGHVTLEDLLGGGFTEGQISKHKDEAARIARLSAMTV